MKCKKCGKEVINEAKFCSGCGAVLEQEIEVTPVDEMEASCSCGYAFDSENQQFCPKCGNKRKIILKNCPFCNAPVLNQGDVFCSVCGKKYEQQSITDKVKDNDFLKSVGEDFRKSQSIQKLKKTAENGIDKIKEADKNTKKKMIIAASVIIPIIILIIIICSIHVCDDCGETYFGSRNKESMWGETWYVCDDCYDFYW